MEPIIEHPWDISPGEAIKLQMQLREHVILENSEKEIHVIAGTDVSYDASKKEARGVVALLSYPDLQLQSYTTSRIANPFPYIPGLLSFREIPALVECFWELQSPPDLILCDGHGLAHPRRFGLACHLGVLFDIPTIGVAKRILVGEHETLPEVRGAWKELMFEGEIIGAALRSRPGTNPIYVSVGHRICLETALKWVVNCLGRYRLPETTRWAHRLSKSA
jgi:deoxyribonuclease V